MHHVRAVVVLLAAAALSCQSLRPQTRQLELVSATRINPDGSVQVLERSPGTVAGTFFDEHLRGFVGAMRDHFDLYLHLRHDTLALIHWDTATYRDDAGGDHMGLLSVDRFNTGMDILRKGEFRYFVGPDDLATVDRFAGNVDASFPPFLANLPAGAKAEIVIPAHIHGKAYKYVFAFRKGPGS